MPSILTPYSAAFLLLSTLAVWTSAAPLITPELFYGNQYYMSPSSAEENGAGGGGGDNHQQVRRSAIGGEYPMAGEAIGVTWGKRWGHFTPYELNFVRNLRREEDSMKRDLRRSCRFKLCGGLLGS